MIAKRVRQLLVLSRYRFHTSSVTCNQTKTEDLPKTIKEEPSEMMKRSLSVEKQSLTRGLALNKFEKDFMIYPEHEDSDEYEKICGYIKELSSDYKNALPAISIDSPESLSHHALQVLERNKVYSTFVPREFGGFGFNQKDLTMVSETLGQNDLALFVTFNQAQSAAALISIFGTDEQKAKYLPAIAAFECKPAICIHDDNTGESGLTEVWQVRGHPALLNGVKTNVINAQAADIFLVFAKENVGTQKSLNCYIVDRKELGLTGKIEVLDRVKTQGLNAVSFSRVQFRDVVVGEPQMVGVSRNSATDMLEELRLNGKTFYGSAVVGFLKKLTEQLAEFANSRMEGNIRLADLHPVQSAMTNLATGIYVLESMSYYISGLCDEDLFLQNDVENSIMQRYANRILREAVTSCMDVAGVYATNADFPFDRVIRDAMTLISTTESDLNLVRRIALPTIETFIKEHGSLSTFMSKFTVQKLFGGAFSTSGNFKEPRLTHFIAEHVHPSLEISARSLEQSMSRVKLSIDQLLTDRGLYIKDDYVALMQLSIVLENNMGMTATISRASRSYSIGLRNSETEMGWCNYYCQRVAKENENILQELINIFGLITLTPKVTLLGKLILENKGYFLENPVERNW